MSIGEHLEELRRRLAWGLLAVAVTTILCLVFQDRLMDVVTWPYHRATALADRIRPPRKDPVAEALARARAAHGDEAILALTEACEAMAAREEQRSRTLVALRFTESFMSYLKVAIVGGLALGGPFLIYQLWAFVAAGLYPHERRWVTRYLPLSVTLFLVGIAFGYYVLVPVTLAYLAAYADPSVVTNVFQLGPYLNLFFGLTVAVGVAFQLPVVMLFVQRALGVEPATFSRYRRHAILVIAVVAAIVTPSPDPVSMMALAIPMCLLYEMGIILGRWR